MRPPGDCLPPARAYTTLRPGIQAFNRNLSGATVVLNRRFPFPLKTDTFNVITAARYMDWTFFLRLFSEVPRCKVGAAVSRDIDVDRLDRLAIEDPVP